MPKKHLAIYSVSFLHTYSTKVRHRKKWRTITRTIHRNKIVEASNPQAAATKAKRGLGPGGFSRLVVTPTQAVPPSGFLSSTPVFRP